MGDKTVAQLQAEWVTHGNIARLQSRINSEADEGKRRGLEELLVEQRKLIAPG